MQGSPSFELLDPPIRELFEKCFVEGHFNPALRPDAQTWQQVLKQAELSMATCKFNDQHRFPRHLKTCPWCERRQALGGLDPFPSQAAVQHSGHLLTPSRHFQLAQDETGQTPELGFDKAVAIAQSDIRRKKISWWVLIITVSVLGLFAILYWLWAIRFLLSPAEAQIITAPL